MAIDWLTVEYQPENGSILWDLNNAEYLIFQPFEHGESNNHALNMPGWIYCDCESSIPISTSEALEILKSWLQSTKLEVARFYLD